MTYSIGDLAKPLSLSRRTLLYYEKLGLLTASIRRNTNYLYYKEQDYQRLAKIIVYRETGMSLQVIAGLLSETLATFFILRICKPRRCSKQSAVVQCRGN